MDKYTITFIIIFVLLLVYFWYNRNKVASFVSDANTYQKEQMAKLPKVTASAKIQ